MSVVRTREPDDDDDDVGDQDMLLATMSETEFWLIASAMMLVICFILPLISKTLTVMGAIVLVGCLIAAAIAPAAADQEISPRERIAYVTVVRRHPELRPMAAAAMIDGRITIPEYRVMKQEYEKLATRDMTRRAADADRELEDIGKGG
jgi:hypothetical protein